MANTITPTPSSPGFRVVTVGTGKQYADTAAFLTYCKSQDVKSNQEILCGEFYESQILPYVDFEALGGRTNDSYYYLLRPVPGMDQAYDGDGAPVAYANSGIEMVFNTANPPRMRTGFRVEGFKVRFTGTVNNSPALNMQYDFNTGDKLSGFRKCRIMVEVSSTFAIRVGLDYCGISLEDNLVFFASNCSAALYFNGLATASEYRNTYARLGVAGYVGLNDNSGVKDSNVYYNMGGASYAAYGGGSASYTNNISDNAAETHSGFTVVDPATMFAGNGDFRPKTGGSLINAASPGSANTTDLFSKLRGSSPNAGAIQRDYLPGLPQGVITSTTVAVTSGNKRSVTISGTTTGVPTSGRASITPTSITGNHAVAQTNAVVTLGDGTFTVTFNDVKVGQYSKTITLTNATGSAGVSDSNVLSVTGATGVITNQPAPKGQLQSVSGTTTGSPDSGTITWPANVAANDTSNQGPFALTLGTNTFSDVDRALPPGTYDAPVYDFTIPAGTSLPSSTGGSGVMINGVSGNPQMPDPTETPVDPGDTTPPVLSNPMGGATGATTATVGVATNEGNGTLYALVNGAATATVAAIKAGMSQAVTSSGFKSFDVTGLSQSTTYYVHFVQTDAAGNTSVVSDSPAFMTQALPVIPAKVVYLVNGRLCVTVS